MVSFVLGFIIFLSTYPKALSAENFKVLLNASIDLVGSWASSWAFFNFAWYCSNSANRSGWRTFIYVWVDCGNAPLILADIFIIDMFFLSTCFVGCLDGDGLFYNSLFSTIGT